MKTLSSIARLQKTMINQLDRFASAVRIAPPGDALLETTVRRTGRPRVTSVSDASRATPSGSSPTRM